MEPPSTTICLSHAWQKLRPGLLSKGLGRAQVRQLALVLLAFRLGVLPAEQAAPLKLLEKGVSKEALAGLVRLLFWVPQVFVRILEPYICFYRKAFLPHGCFTTKSGW